MGLNSKGRSDVLNLLGLAARNRVAAAPVLTNFTIYSQGFKIVT
jgi:hypothetical protein